MHSINQITSLLVLLLLLGLIAAASASLYHIKALSLPISQVTAIAAILLPILNGVSIRGAQSYATRSKRSGRNRVEFLSWPTLSAFVLLAIYETVVATLALTHMVPQEDLTCPLERRWGQLYSARDAEAIRRIQDTHQCCGLVTTKDKAWPFQGIDHPSDACVKAFDRHKSCLGVWRQDEQIFAGLLLLVALTTFILKFLILLRLVSERPDSWIHHIVGSRYPALTAGGQDRLEAGSSNEHTNGISRRIEAAYSDDAVEDADEEQTVPQLAETSANRGGDTESRRNNQGLVVQPSRLIDDRNEWANE